MKPASSGQNRNGKETALQHGGVPGRHSSATPLIVVGRTCELGRSPLSHHAYQRFRQTPPSASAPSASSTDEPDDHEQQDGADRSVDDLRDDPRTEMDSELRKYPARNRRPLLFPRRDRRPDPNPYLDDDLARKPTSRDADSQYDDEGFH